MVNAPSRDSPSDFQKIAELQDQQDEMRDILFFNSVHGISQSGAGFGQGRRSNTFGSELGAKAIKWLETAVTEFDELGNATGVFDRLSVQSIAATVTGIAGAVIVKTIQHMVDGQVYRVTPKTGKTVELTPGGNMDIVSTIILGIRDVALLWKSDDTGLVKVMVGGVSGGGGSIPIGTVENEHLEWNNTSLTWNPVQAMTHGATGPFAASGFHRYANDQIIAASRNLDDDGDIQLKLTGAGFLDITSDFNDPVGIQVRAQDAVNLDATFAITQFSDLSGSGGTVTIDAINSVSVDIDVDGVDFLFLSAPLLQMKIFQEVDMNAKKITQMLNPTLPQDAVTLDHYLNSGIFLDLDGSTPMQGDLDMANFSIENSNDYRLVRDDGTGRMNIIGGVGASTQVLFDAATDIDMRFTEALTDVFEIQNSTNTIQVYRLMDMNNQVLDNVQRINQDGTVPTSGFINMANSQALAWEASPPGDDGTFLFSGSELFTFGGNAAYSVVHTNGASMGTAGLRWGTFFGVAADLSGSLLVAGNTILNGASNSIGNTDSDVLNIRGEIKIQDIAIPGTPAAGTVQLFVDAADGVIKVKKSDTSVVSLEGAGGGGSTQGLHSMWLGAGGFIPVDSGAFGIATLGTTATEKGFGRIPFAQSIDTFATYTFTMPGTWDLNNVKVIVYWDSPNGGTGNVVWQAGLTSVSDAFNFGNATYGSLGSVTDAAGAGGLLRQAEMASVPIGETPINKDLIVLKIVRNGNSGSDTYLDDANFWGVRLTYTTNLDVDPS